MPAEITSGPMPSAGMEAIRYEVVDGGGASGWSTEMEPIAGGGLRSNLYGVCLSMMLLVVVVVTMTWLDSSG